MTLPPDYVERVYAGVLGKIIGVYLGRPFEGWPYEKIIAELGEIWYYVHEKRGVPLIVTDDDISGTFTFVRALEDYGNARSLTPVQIGQTWMNYNIEKRTILWWGGLGNSTEHTAYLRMKRGILPPHSGSIAVNGKVVAEQIGAQIFIDGWAMVAPGDPALAADLARRAASVSHDGEAIYGAQVIAALEAQAFVESDTSRLLDTAVRFIPKDSLIYRLIAELRELHSVEPDWRKARQFIVENYGYDKYGGNCHMIPNHALIILGLLYGDDDFQKALMITNTCGWDTDCNSANIGCLMGIKNGLAGINAGPDWRGPIADRLYNAAADPGRVISDAVIETYHLVNSGRALAGEPPLAPKNGARFHFELPGSVQGFHAAGGELENVAGHSQYGSRALALHAEGASRLATNTFIPPEAIKMPGYGIMASPTLYPAQTARAGLSASGAQTGCWFLQIYNADDQLQKIEGNRFSLQAGEYKEIEWRLPDSAGFPIAEIGLEFQNAGDVYLDYLTWQGTPQTTFTRPQDGGWLWSKAWVDGMDQWEGWGEVFRLIQNEGRGLLMQGCREWTDYCASAEITPHLAQAFGLAVRVQGMRRYYALLLRQGNKAQLVKALDGEKILAETDFHWELYQPYALTLQVEGARLRAWVGAPGKAVQIFDVVDVEQPLNGGALALVCEEGRVAAEAVSIKPAQL